MRPFIRDGDILEIAPTSERPLRCGDTVLVMTSNDKLLAHRAIKSSSSGGKIAFLIKRRCLRSTRWVV